MSKCKCLCDYKSNEVANYLINKYYNYEFIPSIGDRSGMFRVYDESGGFHNFAFTEFRKFFKQY